MPAQTFILRSFFQTVLIATLALGVCISAHAEGKNVEQLTQQLETVESQLRDQKDSLEEQRQSAANLEQKVECNWKLLKSYEQCEDNHPKNTREYLTCMKKAKSSSGNCDTI